MSLTMLRTRLLFLCLLIAVTLGANCQSKSPRLLLDSPTHSEFLNGTTVTVVGRAINAGAYESLTVNGIPAGPLSGNDFSVDIPLDPSEVFNQIHVELVLAGGHALHQHATVVVGDGVTTGFVLDGELSPDAAVLRIGDTGLDQIAPIVESLSGDSLDISDMITDQNPIASGSMSGINYTANVVEVAFGGFGLATDTTPSGIDTTIAISDFFVEIDLDLGWLGSCTLEIETTNADIQGSYDLSPLASDPSFVDVNLVSAISVTLGGFSSQFVSGICDDPLIGDIVNLIMGQGDIQQLMEDGFQGNLADPDGTGPLDSPLAAAIETALAGISIAGPIGDALGGVMDAPITAITEEASGLTLTADAAIYSSAPAPDAPEFAASYTVQESLPTFGTTTPVGGLPYGMAFGISTSAMNQLLKTQVEGGLLASTLTEFDLGAGPIPLTTGFFYFIPEFGIFPPETPIAMHIRPTLAPVFTGAAGPAGEFAEMKIAGLAIDIEKVADQTLLLSVQVSLDAGLDLAFTSEGLEFSLATPASQDIEILLVENPLGANETAVIALFQLFFPYFAPELESAIDAFPIPSLLGLDLEPVELARLSGGFIGLFANLVQTPTTTLQNVSFTDTSSGGFRQQGGCWLREWRHRLSGLAMGNTISANQRGMLGADAGCTTNDASSSATASYQVDFDVDSVAGEQWTIQIDHSILGAFDRISDGYNDGIGFKDGGGTASFGTAVTASYQIAGGASGNFDFTPSVTSISDGIGGSSTDEDVEFSGQNGVALVGTGNASVTLVFAFDLDAFSNSNTWFPTANGDEMAIRLGKNDTIDNNFTAGGYPGMGNRNIADDGHTMSVQLSVEPTP
ncbi:MAG: hypothetical protein GY723_02900 [bacterium]|nr:hypothetical protein [bacterium]